ncbi:MAG: hypothetical protein EBX33_00510 [Synechococcaceae bacterium WB8_1A_041]|nr:hypothetical protein [Synechococcaceae bacterium WB6_1A_059]NBP31974.1 hypothetical protein [Synechococcaceae bacterium WB6_1B_055]NBQ18049.1 hypothetical protein [Synechococcaceae bacterium WB5_2A_257]NBY59974.1 hypothetical protein [Synechococcaceae bacterium LLD_019]NCU75687.1 hypothetical protein [Synechococcaceae bacterium WB7_1C_051]NCU90366.1 hypothetical protein [Synechococcaceae bacterium WB7_1B_046]NCY13158.1 hypothetical protein [Synechococcaceae bacterium WB8_1A_041]OUE48963.1
MAEIFPLNLIESLAMEVDTFKNTSDDLERNCWLVVHRFQHGVLPSEYDIREIPEDLYLQLLAHCKAVQGNA